MAFFDRLKGAQGTTLLEVAAVLPLLFWLTFGMIDFGRYFYAASAIQAAAQEGARAGLGTDGVVNLLLAENAAQAGLLTLDTDNIDIRVDQPTLETVAVEISYQFEFITPFFVLMIPDNQFEIRGGASMVIY